MPIWFARALYFPATVNRTLSPIMSFDLTDEETDALAKHLRQALDYARYPFAPGSIP